MVGGTGLLLWLNGDQILTLVMDIVAEAEGQKAIDRNRALKENGDLVIPEGLNQKCMEIITRMVK